MNGISIYINIFYYIIPNVGITMKKIHIYLIAIVLIIIMVAVLMFAAGSLTPSTSLVSYDNKPVSASFLKMLVIPNNVSSQVGMGVAPKSNVEILNATPIAINGKPEILYIGAEFCPFCAAQRWPLLIALMRFGNFTGIKYMTSSATDYAPSTPTFTFYNSTYTSPYISFVAVEQTTNTYKTLQQPNSTQAYLFSKYDPNGNIPFILFANRTVWGNADYDPLSVLGGKNWTDIATLLHNSSSVQSLAIVGTANLMTAQICSIDNNSPARVCNQPYIRNLMGYVK